MTPSFIWRATAKFNATFWLWYNTFIWFLINLWKMDCLKIIMIMIKIIFFITSSSNCSMSTYLVPIIINIITWFIWRFCLIFIYFFIFCFLFNFSDFFSTFNFINTSLHRLKFKLPSLSKSACSYCTQQVIITISKFLSHLI